jgi:hypothetical protein
LCWLPLLLLLLLRRRRRRLQLARLLLWLLSLLQLLPKLVQRQGRTGGRLLRLLVAAHRRRHAAVARLPRQLQQDRAVLGHKGRRGCVHSLLRVAHQRAAVSCCPTSAARPY